MTEEEEMGWELKERRREEEILWRRKSEGDFGDAGSDSGWRRVWMSLKE